MTTEVNDWAIGAIDTVNKMLKKKLSKKQKKVVLSMLLMTKLDVIMAASKLAVKEQCPGLGEKIKKELVFDNERDMLATVERVYSMVGK